MTHTQRVVIKNLDEIYDILNDLYENDDVGTNFDSYDRISNLVYESRKIIVHEAANNKE